MALAVAGLLFLNSLGVWITLFNPRRGNYSSVMGNDLSLGGNVVLIGGMITALFLPRVLFQAWHGRVCVAGLLVDGPPSLPLLAAAIYWATLKSRRPHLWQPGVRRILACGRRKGRWPS